MVVLGAMQLADILTCGQMQPDALFGNHLFAVMDVLLPTRLHRWPESCHDEKFWGNEGLIRI